MIPFMEFQEIVHDALYGGSRIVYDTLYGVSRNSLLYPLWSFKKKSLIPFMEFHEKVYDTLYEVSRKSL